MIANVPALCTYSWIAGYAAASVSFADQQMIVPLHLPCACCFFLIIDAVGHFCSKRYYVG
jgi:hypothetical protein